MAEAQIVPDEHASQSDVTAQPKHDRDVCDASSVGRRHSGEHGDCGAPQVHCRPAHLPEERSGNGFPEKQRQPKMRENPSAEGRQGKTCPRSSQVSSQVRAMATLVWNLSGTIGQGWRIKPGSLFESLACTGLGRKPSARQHGGEERGQGTRPQQRCQIRPASVEPPGPVVPEDRDRSPMKKLDHIGRKPRGGSAKQLHHELSGILVHNEQQAGRVS